MGTLTADCPRLDDHCPHKLPSSCRLTSTPDCCACADERGHSTTYRVYIDGVGYVQRGTRWQSYCWFCKSFWDARVAAAGLLPPETKIPEDPDQTEFLERWFEWHRGYRMERNESGSEERVDLQGERLADADPGFLPRTQQELESGQRHVLASDNRRRAQPTGAEPGPHPSLEDALDELLREASGDESASDRVDDVTTATAPDSSPPMPIPAVQSEATPNTADDPPQLDGALEAAQAAAQAAQRVRDRAQARLANATEELAVAQERLRRIQRQRLAASNYARVFGTREDVDNDDYVSPITSMFTRHHQWAQQNAERQRMLRQQTDRALPTVADVDMESASEGREIAGEPVRDLLTAGTVQTQHTTGPPSRQAEQELLWTRAAGDSHTSVHPHLPGEGAEAAPPAHAATPPALPHISTSNQAAMIRLVELFAFLRPDPPASADMQEPVFAGLDDDTRPEPKTEEEMQFKLECKICLEQVADTACLPCGHLSMCEWCSDRWIPTSTQDRTRPRDRGARCPCCRARVRSRVKIFVG